ncbi:MAG: hypothetical protein EZS28_051874, partial [Streblomastix strix]
QGGWTVDEHVQPLGQQPAVQKHPLSYGLSVPLIQSSVTGHACPALGSLATHGQSSSDQCTKSYLHSLSIKHVSGRQVPDLVSHQQSKVSDPYPQQAGQVSSALGSPEGKHAHQLSGIPANQVGSVVGQIQLDGQSLVVHIHGINDGLDPVVQLGVHPGGELDEVQMHAKPCVEDSHATGVQPVGVGLVKVPPVQDFEAKHSQYGKELSALGSQMQFGGQSANQQYAGHCAPTVQDPALGSPLGRHGHLSVGVQSFNISYDGHKHPVGE